MSVEDSSFKAQSRNSLKRPAHPLDKPQNLAPILDKAQDQTQEKQTVDLVLPSCVTGKIYGLPTNDQDGWASIINNDTASVQLQPDGTVLTIAKDGSKSELRANGTIVCYDKNGQIKSFRVGVQAQQPESNK